MIKTIKLGDESKGYKEYPLRLSTGAFTIFEEKTGLDAFTALSDGKILAKARNMQALIYGGIKMGYLWNEEECPLSFDQVGNLLDVRDMGRYISLALESMRVDEQVGEKKNMKKAV